MSNPVFVLKPLGMVSAFELLAAAMFAALLAWTFFCGIARDFKKSTPEKLLRLHLSRSIAAAASPRPAAALF